MGRWDGPRVSPNPVAGWFGPPGEPRRVAAGFLFCRPGAATQIARFLLTALALLGIIPHPPTAKDRGQDRAPGAWG